MMSGLQTEQELKKEEFWDEDKGTSYLAIQAAQDLIAKANVDPLKLI
jgi:3-oxoacyl-[acyl-carrier-protein] synthase III